MNGRGWIGRLLLAAFALALVLATAEGLLRAAGFPAPAILSATEVPPHQSQPFAHFVYRGYLPGMIVDGANEVRLNALGFHERDYAPARPTDRTYRVMVLGDSYVAALSIPLAQTFHELIEDRLQREDPLGRGSYEVLAFGCGNRAQAEELRWLREYGPQYRPDLVLLVFFCGNDFMENSPELFRDAARFAKFYRLEVAPRKEAIFRRALILPGSRVNGLIASWITDWYGMHLDRFGHGIDRAQLESPEVGVYRTPLSPVWQTAYATTAELLQEVRDEAVRQQARFGLVSLVGPQAIGEIGSSELRKPTAGFDLEQPERWLADWCAEHDVPYQALGPVLARAGARRVFWRHDGHLNAYGNRVIADPVYEFLLGVARRSPPT